MFFTNCNITCWCCCCCLSSTCCRMLPKVLACCYFFTVGFLCVFFLIFYIFNFVYGSNSSYSLPPTKPIIFNWQSLCCWHKIDVLIAVMWVHKYRQRSNNCMRSDYKLHLQQYRTHQLNGIPPQVANPRSTQHCVYKRTSPSKPIVQYPKRRWLNHKGTTLDHRFSFCWCV